MAGDFQRLALEKAEVLSERLKEVLSSGQEHVRAQFGVDLGLKPELYPQWVILSTAAAGLLLLLCLSWAALCGGLFGRKQRGSPVHRGSTETDKAVSAKIVKPDEQKRRNKKKTLEKKTQSNGQPVTVVKEEVKVAQAVIKSAPQLKTQKVHEVQAPAQIKKNKKKTKTDVKVVQQVSTHDHTKEPEDDAWETKVSNREKKQQRRKDKGPEDSGSPGGTEALKSYVEAPNNTRKNRANRESQQSRNTGKGDATTGAVSSSLRDEPSVNGGGWTDVSMKIPGQMGVMEGTKWSGLPPQTHFRTPPQRQSWTQETQAPWCGIDSQMKANLNPVSFSMMGRNTTDPMSSSFELQLPSQPVDDEWSGFNGRAAVDPGSDWNAPAEHWGNYEEPDVMDTPVPPAKEQPGPTQVSDDEKNAEDPSGGAAKSKKKKKKKKTEEEAASDSQVVNTAPKPHEPPPPASKKQNPNLSSSQKKSEQTVEPPKPSQKKKVRKET